MMNTAAVLKSNVLRNVANELRRSVSVRGISSSPLRNDSFKVQDVKDFQERVKNSKVPVIVDFFAT